jgi:hypothetical protein
MPPTARLNKLSPLWPAGLAIATLSLSGCGMVWDDGGQRHAFGFGYISWPLPGAGQKTAVQGIDVVGAAMVLTPNQLGLTLGYSRERSVMLDRDEIVVLKCLDCDLAQADAISGGSSVMEGIKK